MNTIWVSNDRCFVGPDFAKAISRWYKLPDKAYAESEPSYQPYTEGHRLALAFSSMYHIVILVASLTLVALFKLKTEPQRVRLATSIYSAPLFKGPLFSQKCWNRTFSMIIYLLTFYLFDNIEKIYRNHSRESFCYAKGNFDKSARLHVQSERLYFLFAFCARHYPWWSLWQKNTKDNYFIQVNPLFSVVEISKLLLFEEMLVLTSY